MSPPLTLSVFERAQIEEILRRRANDIADFKRELEVSTGQKLNAFPGSVEMALSREMSRLRALAEKVAPPPPADDEID